MWRCSIGLVDSYYIINVVIEAGKLIKGSNTARLAEQIGL